MAGEGLEVAKNRDRKARRGSFVWLSWLISLYSNTTVEHAQYQHCWAVCAKWVSVMFLEWVLAFRGGQHWRLYSCGTYLSLSVTQFMPLKKNVIFFLNLGWWPPRKAIVEHTQSTGENKFKQFNFFLLFFFQSQILTRASSGTLHTRL